MAFDLRDKASRAEARAFFHDDDVNRLGRESRPDLIVQAIDIIEEVDALRIENAKLKTALAKAEALHAAVQKNRWNNKFHAWEEILDAGMAFEEARR